MQGVVDLAGELDKAGFQYQARNRSKAWELDTGWYPMSMCTMRWKIRNML